MFGHVESKSSDHQYRQETEHSLGLQMMSASEESTIFRYWLKAQYQMEFSQYWPFSQWNLEKLSRQFN